MSLEETLASLQEKCLLGARIYTGETRVPQLQEKVQSVFIPY